MQLQNIFRLVGPENKILTMNLEYVLVFFFLASKIAGDIGK